MYFSNNQQCLNNIELIIKEEVALLFRLTAVVVGRMSGSCTGGKSFGCSVWMNGYSNGMSGGMSEGTYGCNAALRWLWMWKYGS